MNGGEHASLDTLRRYDLTIAQPRSGYRFSLDALLLADFVHCPAEARIMDLGTGSGVIPLILCRRFPDATAVGIDINEEMVCLADGNAQRNGCAERTSFLADDVTEITRRFPVSCFDTVTANPPFRTAYSGRVSPRAGRDTARHESTAGIPEFLAAAKYLVKPSGRMFFVHHPERLAAFIHQAALLKLSLLRLRMVHGAPDAPAKIFLAELAKGSRAAATVLPPLIVNDANGKYTSETALILGENTDT